MLVTTPLASFLSITAHSRILTLTLFNDCLPWHNSPHLESQVLQGLSLDTVTTGITPILPGCCTLSLDLHRDFLKYLNPPLFPLHSQSPHNPTPTYWGQNKLGNTEMTETKANWKPPLAFSTLWLKGRYTPSAHFNQSCIKFSIIAYYCTLTTQAFLLFLESQGHFQWDSLPAALLCNCMASLYI